MDLHKQYFRQFYFVILITAINHVTLCNGAVNRLMRSKRFLVEDRFSKATSCCICDDFTDKKCASECRLGHDLCFLPDICTINIQVINGVKYKTSGCGPKSKCIHESQMSFYNNEPCDGLRVNELHNGTTCAYCCQGLNPAVYHYPAYCVDDQHWINSQDLELLGGVIMTKPTVQTVPSILNTTVTTIKPEMVRCDTCEYDKNCAVTDCSTDESYCMNVVQFDEFGNRTVIQKRCANYLECYFDHSGQGCGMESRDQICQFCCQATNDSKTCNRDMIPLNIEWFGDTTSTSTTTTTTTTTKSTTTTTSTSTKTKTPKSTATTSELTTMTPTTLSTTETTERTTSVTPTTHSTNTPTTTRQSTSSSSASTQRASSTSSSTQRATSTSSSTQRATSTFSPLFTRAPKPTTNPSNTDTALTTSASPLLTTKRTPYTLPPTPTICETCIATTDVCDVAFQPTTCEPPYNYCINKITNMRDGLREVNRTCGDFSMCYRDWFLGSSDNDKCRYFDENNVVTLDFTCTFCCIKDECNKPLRPDDGSLYTDF